MMRLVVLYLSYVKQIEAIKMMFINRLLSIYSKLFEAMLIVNIKVLHDPNMVSTVPNVILQIWSLQMIAI